VAEKYVGELANGASEAAGRAIALDPASPHALAAQGAVRMFLHWSFLDAEAALERALAIDPEHEMSLYYSSRLRLLRRDFDDAIALARRAQRVNPVSPLFEVQEALVHYVQRDFGKTVEILHRVLDRERNDTIAHYYLALSYASWKTFTKPSST
jgi:tetratricopeptide (TPR) repeat protein